MSEPAVTVIVTRRRGRDAVDAEIRVGTLEELYEACRAAGPSEHVRVSLIGPEGEVRLSFASLIRQS